MEEAPRFAPEGWTTTAVLVGGGGGGGGLGAAGIGGVLKKHIVNPWLMIEWFRFVRRKPH